MKISLRPKLVLSNDWDCSSVMPKESDAAFFLEWKECSTSIPSPFFTLTFFKPNRSKFSFAASQRWACRSTYIDFTPNREAMYEKSTPKPPVKSTNSISSEKSSSFGSPSLLLTYLSHSVNICCFLQVSSFLANSESTAPSLANSQILEKWELEAFSHSFSFSEEETDKPSNLAANSAL